MSFKIASRNPVSPQLYVSPGFEEWEGKHTVNSITQCTLLMEKFLNVRLLPDPWFLGQKSSEANQAERETGDLSLSVAHCVKSLNRSIVEP
jgi:hypothetical protein